MSTFHSKNQMSYQGQENSQPKHKKKNNKKIAMNH